jgi:hypothetical protein
MKTPQQTPATPNADLWLILSGLLVSLPLGGLSLLLIWTHTLSFEWQWTLIHIHIEQINALLRANTNEAYLKNAVVLIPTGKTLLGVKCLLFAK